MTILQQVLLAFAAFVLFIFAIRLVFALLLRLQLLPILVWLGVGRLYPQWAAAHPFVFYGVLALFALLALSCWLRPVVEWVQERQMLRLAERADQKRSAPCQCRGTHHYRISAVQRRTHP